MELTSDKGYRDLLQNISETYTQGRMQAVQAVNSQITQTYWRVGRQIVEFEQGGKARAEYGTALISTLARDLTLRHGKGFSRSNLTRFRQLYLAWPIGATLSHQLGWSAIVELLKIDDPLERSFYEQQTVRERWSVRELVRQKDSALFLRLAASKDKAGILQLAAKGQLIEQPAHRHHPEPQQGRVTGRIRHLPNEQPAVCAEVPALPARARRTAPRAGADLATGWRQWRGIVMIAVAAGARSNGAGCRIGMYSGYQQACGRHLAAAFQAGSV